MKMKNQFKNMKIIFSLALIFHLPLLINAQENKTQLLDRDTLITTAKKIMETARYCALITLDSTGHPDARIMDPFPPDDDMIIWLGTNLSSRKVGQIKNDSRVTLYYQAPNAVGYAIIKGDAHIVEDTSKKQTYWKNEWSRFYTDNKSNYVLIKVVPEKLEVIDYQNGIAGETKTWAVPFVEFNLSK